MKNFVVSLTNNNEKRREHINDEFSKHGVDFEFFDAVTPDKNKEFLLKYGLNEIQTALTDREVSCLLSHYLLWRKIIELNLEYASIFEDDIYLGGDAHQFLANGDWVDPNIDIIKLEKTMPDKIRTSISYQKIYNRKLYELKSQHVGTGGYVLTNKGARFLIKYFSNLNVLLPVDIVIFSALLNKKTCSIRQLLPAICIQDCILNEDSLSFKSDLDGERLGKKDIEFGNKEKKSIIFKIRREVSKPFLNFIYGKLFIKTVDYK